jgi:hypothetical protein
MRELPSGGPRYPFPEYPFPPGGGLPKIERATLALPALGACAALVALAAARFLNP